MEAVIFDVKEMAIRDGPGVRTTVFFKGCPLRCRWCHNPEGLSSAPQLMVRQSRCSKCGLCRRGCDHPECAPFGRCLHVCPNGCISVSGRRVSSDALASQLLKSAELLRGMEGGVTFSGGEPLLQGEYLLELTEKLNGMHTCIETSGYADGALFRSVVSRLDYVIMDLKLMDPAAHREETGVGNERILSNARWLRDSGLPHEFRTPLIPGITDTEENLSAIEAFVGGSSWVKLPYNTLAGAKYPMLGMTYPLREEQKTDTCKE